MVQLHAMFLLVLLAWLLGLSEAINFFFFEVTKVRTLDMVLEDDKQRVIDEYQQSKWQSQH